MGNMYESKILTYNHTYVHTSICCSRIKFTLYICTYIHTYFIIISYKRVIDLGIVRFYIHTCSTIEYLMYVCTYVQVFRVLRVKFAQDPNPTVILDDFSGSVDLKRFKDNVGEVSNSLEMYTYNVHTSQYSFLFVWRYDFIIFRSLHISFAIITCFHSSCDIHTFKHMQLLLCVGRARQGMWIISGELQRLQGGR